MINYFIKNSYPANSVKSVFSVEFQKFTLKNTYSTVKWISCNILAYQTSSQTRTGKTDLTGVTGERLNNNRIHYRACLSMVVPLTRNAFAEKRPDWFVDFWQKIWNVLFSFFLHKTTKRYIYKKVFAVLSIILTFKKRGTQFLGNDHHRRRWRHHHH